MPEINKINLMIDGNMDIYKSDAQKITIVAQRNIIENITKEVKNGQWDIKFKEIVRNHEGISFIINTPLIN